MINEAQMTPTIPSIIPETFASFGKVVYFKWSLASGWPILDVSDNVAQLLGYTKEELLKTHIPYVDLIYPDDLSRITQEVEAGGNTQTNEFEHAPYRIVTKNGSTLWVKDHTQSIKDASGELTHYIGYIFDINLYQKAMHDATMYQQLLDQNTLLSVSDAEGRILEISTKLLELSGYTKEEVLHKPHAIFRDPDTPALVYQALWKTIKEHKTWRGVIKNSKKDGSIFYTDIIISPLMDFEGNIEKYVAIRHDVTNLMEAKERLKKLSRTDALTGIGNRVKLVRDIEKYTQPFVAMFDIARFNEINDFYGYELGDQILKAFVQTLKETLPPTGNLYRINADEFVFMDEVPHCHSQNTCVETLRLIHENLNKRALIVQENLIMLSVLTSLSFEAKAHLLLSADIAKNHGKKHHLSFCLYSREIEIQKQSKNNILWASKIKEALDADNIIVYYQAIYDNTTQRIAKYEALVRLKNGQDIIAPYKFIDIAKKTHQYLEITKTVIRKTCMAFSNTMLSFSINVTMEDIEDETLGLYLWEMVETYGVQGRMILEIVETENIKNFRKVEAFIAKARRFGIKIAIDDFGTGYSNFENLYKIKSDFIKIDGSLIQNIYSVDSTLGVIKAIVAFAHSCGSKTIAEYVSSELLFKTVCDLGIDFSQGFFIGEPKVHI